MSKHWPVVWTGVAVGALIGGTSSGLALAGVGAVAAVLVRDAPMSRRVLLALTLAPAAIPDAAPIGWIVAAWSMATLSVPEVRPDPRGDLQWRLAWCRRREERVAVVSVLLGPGVRPETLLQTLRRTDSAAVKHRLRGIHVHGVLDEHDLVGVRVEERIREAAGGRAHIGWATFPDDGVTLDSLLERADHAAYTAAQQTAASTTRAPTWPRDVEPAPIAETRF